MAAPASSTARAQSVRRLPRHHASCGSERDWHRKDGEIGIELSQIVVRWIRPKEIVLNVTVNALDAALLVALGRRSKRNMEGQAATERGKGFVLFSIATA